MFYLPVAGAFLWFVFALFLIFLIIPIFNTRKHLFILLFISLVLYLIPLSFPRIFCLSQFKMNLLYFVVGCALFEWVNVRHVFDKIHFLITLFLFAGMYLLKPYIEVNALKKILTIFIAFVGIIFILNLSKQIELKTVYTKKILLGLSVYSYTIYLFHTTFEGFAKAVLHPTLINFNNQLIFTCIALIVILAGCIAPTILQEIIDRFSRLFSYLIGAKYENTKNREEMPASNNYVQGSDYN